VSQLSNLPNATSLRKSLVAGVKLLKLNISEGQINQLLEYLSLIIQWNKAYNLTAIRNPDDMISQHILDALSINTIFLEECQQLAALHAITPRCLDLGSGVGIPGVVLAIVNPQLQWSLIDSNGKKARFLREVVRKLGLLNIQVEQARLETLNFDAPVIITARALASIQQILEWLQGHFAVESCLLLMKSVQAQQELTATYNGFTLTQVVALEVPGIDAERCVVVMKSSH